MRPHGDDWVPLCKREKINVMWISAICANQLMTNFIWIPISVLTNPYCKKLGLNNVATTMIQLIGSVVGLLVPPFAAVWSDTTRMKFGRRRIWMIGGEILVLIGLMLVSFCREISPSNHNGAVAVFVIGQILASVGGNTANGPGRSMCSDVVPANQQVLVTNICTLYGGLAGVISNLVGALKLYQYTSLTNETLVLMISCIIGFVALVISVVFTPEEQLKEKPNTVNAFSLIGAAFKSMSKSLILVCFANAFYQLGVQMFSWQNVNYIATKVFGGDPLSDDGVYDAGVSHAQLLALIQTIVQVVFSFFNTFIVNALGLKWSWILGMICGIIGDVVFFANTNKWVYLIPYIGQGVIAVMGSGIPLAFVSLTVPTEKLAGMITIVILFGNISGVLAQFALNMGLGSIEWFSSNTGRLIGLPFLFIVVAIVLGYMGFNYDGKDVNNQSEEAASDLSESSSEKPEAL